MQVHINDAFVSRRATIGKWASLAGLVVLGAGLVVSLKSPTLFYVSFITLIVGFLLSNVGLYYANRYLRVDRPDAVLVRALKGLDDRYALYQFLLPASHVLQEPGGLTVFVLKPQEGLVFYQNGRWRNKQGWMRLLRWVGQEGVGRPEREVEAEVEVLRQWLHNQAPDLEVPVRGGVVFTNPRVALRLEDPPVPTMVPKKVKVWLRKSGKRPPLPQETQRRLREVLNAAAGV